MDQLEYLEQEAEKAGPVAIAASIDYLSNIWRSNRFTWALIGGIAMQKYGMLNRTTTDSDIAVSASLEELRNAILDDQKCAVP